MRPTPPPLGPYFAHGQAASPVISHLVVSHKWPLSAPRALIYCLNISSAQQHLQKTSASAQTSPGGRPPRVRPPKHCAHALSTGFPRKCALSREPCRKCPVRASTVPCLALSVESARWVQALCPALHFRPKVHAGCLCSALPCTFEGTLSKVSCSCFHGALPCTFGRKCTLGACALPCLALSTESARGVPANFLALHFRPKVRNWFFSALLPVCFCVHSVALHCIFGRKCPFGSFVLSGLALSVESAHWIFPSCLALHFQSKVHAGCLRSALPCTFGRKCALGISVLSCLALSVESACWVPALCPALHFRSKVRVR